MRYKFDIQPSAQTIANAMGVDITALKITQQADGSWLVVTPQPMSDIQLGVVVASIAPNGDPNADIVDKNLS